MRTALTFVILCCVGIAQSQSLFSFEALTRKDTAIAYRGFDNPIRISDYKEGLSYRVEAGHGEVSDIDKNGVFRYSHLKYGMAYDTLTLFIGNRWQGNMSVALARIPDPQVRLAGGIPGTINRAWLLAAPHVVALYPGCYFRCYLRVTSFQLKVVCGGIETYFEIRGNQITADALNLISTYKGRLKLYFDHVRYDGCGGCGRTTSFSYELF